MKDFYHPADDLHEQGIVVFTAQSCRNFHQRMLICKYVFEQGRIPVNPFNLYGYFLYELVDRDQVRNANNNILSRCDELWVFGEVSDGVLSEILTFQKWGRPVRYFDITGLPEKVSEISPDRAVFEEDIKDHRDLIL